TRAGTTSPAPRRPAARTSRWAARTGSAGAAVEVAPPASRTVRPPTFPVADSARAPTRDDERERCAEQRARERTVARGATGDAAAAAARRTAAAAVARGRVAVCAAAVAARRAAVG